MAPSWARFGGPTFAKFNRGYSADSISIDRDIPQFLTLERYTGDIFRFVSTTLGVAAAMVGTNMMILFANTDGLKSRMEATFMVVKDLKDSQGLMRDENAKMKEDIRDLSAKIDALTKSMDDWTF